ncbi:25S rRNA (uracil2843-N3)-methyltransferase, partial [Tremellales sp. Uapishka_1]
MTHRSRAPPQSSQLPPRPKSARVKTPKKLHHPPPANAAASASISSTSVLPAHLATPSDADVLLLIRKALLPTLTSPDFLSRIQKIKTLLYDKKWLEVFNSGNEGMLDVYAGRWVPSRAIGFRSLLGSLEGLRKAFGWEEEAQAEGSEKRKVISLGGGAGSELLAVAALVKASQPFSCEWVGIDIGDWSRTLSKFEDTIREEWSLPSETLAVEYIKADLLSSDVLASHLTPSSPSSTLLTLLFTLTELFAQSRAATLSLLARITQLSAPGTLFLVADSASDISHFALGAEGREYPIFMILDMVLIGRQGGWEVVEEEDSRWFRLGEEGREWECKLENLRCWFRLYRRL